MADERYDFVVLGATGFTGREAVRYLVSRPPEALGRWAIAGRSQAKLSAVLAALAPGRDDIGMLVADMSDAASVAAMMARTRVLMHLAGPYAPYGENLVQACLEHRCHYIDLTGEMAWVGRMARKYHEPAAERKLKLVFSAGYEALPFDMATLMAVRSLQERHGVDCRRVDVVATAKMPKGMGLRDLLSGGSINTLREELRSGAAEDPRDPAALIEDDAEAAAVRARSPIVLAPWYDAELGGYMGPGFPAQHVNPAIVLRSAALYGTAGLPYGDGFAFREGVRLGPSLGHRIAAQTMCLSVGAAGLTTRDRRSRRLLLALLDRFGPVSGEGPSERALADSRYRLVARARAESGECAWVILKGEGNPGYRSTARMIVEGALALAFDGAKQPPIFGVVTPATGLGLAIVDRLRDAEITLEVKHTPPLR
jgi:short subunit dehydrogenase-like uncharacterized protein